MRDFQIHDIPTRTGYDQWRDRQRLKERIKTVSGLIFLLSLSGGIGALIALTSFPR